MATTSKILQMLTAKKSDVNQKQAERIARQLKRNQEKKIDDLDAKRDSLLGKKESLEMLSIDMSEAKINSWADDYHQATVDLALIEKEIQIANSTLKDLF